jgi:hypothetical protein
MQFAVALVFPWFAFLKARRPRAGALAMGLQISIVGWLPATVWALRVERAARAASAASVVGRKGHAGKQRI